MKLTRTAALLAAACLLTVFTLTGCDWFRRNSPPPGDLPSTLSSTDSGASSDAESSPSSVTEEASSSETNASSSANTSDSQQDESIPMPTHSEPSVTGNQTFNQVFSKNPIDAHYNQSGAASVQEMVEIATECTGLWQAEIESAYQKLLKVMDASSVKTLTSEQDAWISSQATEIAAIQKKASSEEGSNAALVAANLTMQFYRTRAAELYLKLYSYDPAFSYAYSNQ